MTIKPESEEDERDKGFNKSVQCFRLIVSKALTKQQSNLEVMAKFEGWTK